MKNLSRFAIFLLLMFPAGKIFAQGGACPTGASYIKPSNPAGPLVSLSSLGITGCYYVSAAGSDANSGTSESSPWRHAPGMPSCTSGNCRTFDNNSGNPGSFPAGTGLIFRGGDSWTYANGDTPWMWRSPGGNGSPIYLGVDPNWYSGSSWTRPTLDLTGIGGATGVGSAFATGGGGQGVYNILDDFEFKGLYTCIASGSGYSGYYQAYESNATLERSYFHGWSHCSTPNVPDGCELADFSNSNGQTNWFVYFNVWDGSDSTNGGDSCYAIGPSGSIYGGVIAYNYVQDVANGMVIGIQYLHDNALININHDYALSNGFGSYHGNGFEAEDPASPAIYWNNVVIHVDNPDGYVTFWDGPENGTIDYIFNNVIGDATGNTFNTQTGTGTQSHGGYVYLFNNTAECGADSGPSLNCAGDTSQSQANSHFINNHFITSDSPPPIMYYSAGNVSNIVTQTKAAAKGQGFSLSQGNVFSPTSGSGATVNAGTNLSSVCSTISSLNAAAGTACFSDTTYGVSYNTTGHAVSWPARTPNPRSGSGSWDAGAYQFSGKVPSTPINLKATVNQ